MAQETLPATVTGSEGEFAVNGKFFKDALGHVSSEFSTTVNEARVPLYFVSESRQVEHVVLKLID